MAHTEKQGKKSKKWRQQEHHKATKKYEKQRVRTAYNKLEARLLNAARYDKGLLRSFYEEKGGKKQVLWQAQNAVTLSQYLGVLAKRAPGPARHQHNGNGRHNGVRFGLEGKQAHLFAVELATCRDCHTRKEQAAWGICFAHMRELQNMQKAA